LNNFDEIQYGNTNTLAMNKDVFRKIWDIIKCHCKTNREIAQELNTIPDLDKIQEYRRNRLQHMCTNRTHCNRLPRILKTAGQQAEETKGDH
jgi:hypothetical protein